MQRSITRSMSLTLAARRFPDRRQLVEREFGSNEDFRALCEDLRLCVDALSRWQRSTAPSAAERVAEYAQSLEELEQEVDAWLNEREAGQA